ncbi:TPA: DUF4145 domain-containing protein [Bacillus cereus]|nr:DUF4145 domain-containing protein [Bacillus cereus]
MSHVLFDQNVTFLLAENHVSTAWLDTLPKKCPFCQHIVSPVLILEYDNHPNKSLICGCPDKECGKLYMAEYKLGDFRDYHLKAVYPYITEIQEFSKEIETLSSSFVEIYNQAYKAEQAGLDLICGVGYRKALEFLVKDYAIKLHPADEDNIKKKFLKPCITAYIAHPKVASLAERAVWLGNDETHYVRKWEGKDVQDLKLLIKLTVSYIDMELLTEQIELEMPEGRR